MANLSSTVGAKGTASAEFKWITRTGSVGRQNREPSRPLAAKHHLAELKVAVHGNRRRLCYAGECHLRPGAGRGTVLSPMAAPFDVQVDRLRRSILEDLAATRLPKTPYRTPLPPTGGATARDVHTDRGF
jgi:hypothetical protein